MASGPITFWQIEGVNVEMVADLFSWTPKSLWMVTRVIKLRQLLFGRKAMANSILKSLDITLLTKVHLFKAIVFLVVMYGCESWALQEPRHWKMDAFKLWCWRRLLRVLWTARRSNQSTLMAINPVYSLKDWCWSWSADTLATQCEELIYWKRLWCWEILMPEGEEDVRGWEGWLASLTWWMWVWTKLQELAMYREALCAAFHGFGKSQTWLSDWTTTAAFFIFTL